MLAPGHYERRMKHHATDIAEYKKSEPWEHQYFPSSPDEQKKHLERAKAVVDAHTHAIAVHKSPTSTPKEKEEASRHAEHAAVRYWKADPETQHDGRSEHREDNYNDWKHQYSDAHDDTHVVK